MAFLRSSVLPEIEPVILGERTQMRLPEMRDYAEWARLRTLSRAFLSRWEPTWPADELTKSSFKRRVRHYLKEAREGRSYCFVLFDRETGDLVGGLTLINIRQGVTQSCTLGYWMGEPYANQGFMSDAVRAASEFVFNTLKLRRLEAACLTDNTPSIRLLEKSGFEYEGLARQYLKINGKWQDHMLFAKLAPQAREEIDG